MSFSQKRRRIKPFARPTSFDVNVAFDIRHYHHVKFGKVLNPLLPTASNDEAFHALEGEILMQNSTPSVRRYGDHQMHVFSFANGLQGRDIDEDGNLTARSGDAGSSLLYRASTAARPTHWLISTRVATRPWAFA